MKFQIEIRGRVVDSLNLKPYVPLYRYDVIADTFERACELVHDFETNATTALGVAEHDLVRRTMKLA